MTQAIYRSDPNTKGGMRFVDVWGVSREELETLTGIQIVIGPTGWRSLTAMFKVGDTRAGISELVSRYGAIDFDTVQTSH